MDQHLKDHVKLKLNFAITGVKYFFKYNKIENNYFKLYILYK